MKKIKSQPSEIERLIAITEKYFRQKDLLAKSVTHARKKLKYPLRLTDSIIRMDKDNIEHAFKMRVNPPDRLQSKFGFPASERALSIALQYYGFDSFLNHPEHDY